MKEDIYNNEIETDRGYIKQGDCLELMKTLPDRSIDMIFSDLPYGMTDCKWDKLIPRDRLWTEYRRIVKEHGAIVLFGKEPFSSLLVQSHLRGFKHKWVWDKKLSGSFCTAKYMPLQITEDILVFTSHGEKVNYYPIMRKGKMRKRGGAKVKNAVMNTGLTIGYSNWSNDYFPTNILSYPSKRKGRLHPTEKPIELLEYIIRTYTIENEIVLDTCMGVGSTMVACINTKRKYIGYELNDTYFQLAKQRIKETESMARA